MVGVNAVVRSMQNKNIRHQSNWSKVSFYLSTSLPSKNQLAEIGPDGVVPVGIPPVVPTLDKSLKSDGSLCPVRALSYIISGFLSPLRKALTKTSHLPLSPHDQATVILLHELCD